MEEEIVEIDGILLSLFSFFLQANIWFSKPIPRKEMTNTPSTIQDLKV